MLSLQLYVKLSNQLSLFKTSYFNLETQILNKNVCILIGIRWEKLVYNQNIKRVIFMNNLVLEKTQYLHYRK